MKCKKNCLVLNKHHNINFTERRLKYTIKKLGLTRKNNVTNALLKEIVPLELKLIQLWSTL